MNWKFHAFTFYKTYDITSPPNSLKLARSSSLFLFICSFHSSYLTYYFLATPSSSSYVPDFKVVLLSFTA
jgi:hypothetical protein